MLTEGILSDREIQRALRGGSIAIDPFRVSQLNPTSYDVTLGDTVALYSNWYTSIAGFHPVEDGRFFRPVPGARIFDPKKDEVEVRTFKIDPKLGWVIVPGVAYLMHTVERVQTNDYVPIIDGKSTVGRLFISIHQTAGYGDPGFNGQFTLEVTSIHPVRLYPGMRIGQVRFHTVAGAIGKNYTKTGSYVGAKAKGPVPSNFRRLFKGRK